MFKELWKRYKKETIKILAGWALTSIMVVLFIAFMIVMVEYAIPSKDIGLIIKLSILYFGVNILRTVATFFEDLNDGGYTKAIEADYREKIFLKVQRISQNELDRMKLGEVLENILNDTKEVGKYIGSGIARSYCGGVMRLLGTLCILLFLNIPITIIAFLIYLFGFFITYLFNKKSIAYTELKRNTNAKILNFSNEQVNGYETIKTLEIQEERMSQLKGLLHEYDAVVNKLEKNIRTYTCVYEWIISFIGLVNILLGGMGVIQGFLSYGTLIVLVRYISSPESYAKWIIEGFQIRNLCRISYERIQKVLEKEEEEIEKGETLEKIETIEFNNLSFSYANTEKILEDIAIKVNKDEKIALVGRTGSGKTTIVNLLCRFYEVPDGSIKINGKDYKEYSIKSLRNKIGYIMQKVVIFEESILENINYAGKDIPKERIIEICKKLNLHEKIVSFPEGYETILKEDTNLFSAGEKQLINFARVMVEDPEIIILDEATSSLSYKSEMMVRQAIEEITKGKISFIIAHRLSTIKNCDTIILLQNGKIIEQGNHEELIAKQGEYYELLGMSEG